ncbi:MAG: DNA-binding protein [Flavobacteriales bacterium]|nr:MAG: DNA-binding protein [Flavobacteriales bacterium]
MVITFEKLREIKDNLPNGSMSKIAKELNLDPDTVRNFFGGTHYKEGEIAGIHIEKGPNGGFVKLEETNILDCAFKLIDENHKLN